MCAFLDFERVDPAKVFAGADRGAKQNGKFFLMRQTETFPSCLREDQTARCDKRHGRAIASLGYDV